MTIFYFFNALKSDGLNTSDFDGLISTVIDSDSEFGLKLKQYLLDIIKADVHFFFRVIGNEIISENKVHTEDFEIPDNKEEIKRISGTEVRKYYLHRTLVHTFKHVGYPNRDEPRWIFLSGYFKLIFAYACLGDKNSERAEILCRALRESFKPEKPQALIFKRLQGIHKNNIGLKSVVEHIRDLGIEFHEASRFGQKIDEHIISTQHNDRLYEIMQPYKGALNPKNIRFRNSSERTKKRKVLVKDDISLDENLLHRQMMFNDENGMYITEDDEGEKGKMVLADNYFRSPDNLKKSSEQQQLQNKVNYLHAYRNRLGLPTNPRRLSLEALQSVVALLWKDYMKLLATGLEAGTDEEKEWVAIGAIIISLTSGRSINDVLKAIWRAKSNHNFLKTDGYNINAVHELNVRRLSNLKLVNHQLSQTTIITTPLPPILSELSLASTTFVNDKVKAILQRTAEECSLPFLLEIQINNALFCIIQHHLKEPFHAKVLTGVTASHYPPLTYTSFDIEQLEQTYSQAIGLLTEKLSDNHKAYFTEGLEEGISYEYEQAGSQVALVPSTVTKLFEFLTHRITQYELLDNPHSLQSMTSHFNAYTTWLWHVILLLTGIRPVNHAPGFLKQINLEYKLLWVSDKARDAKDPGRLIPICDFLSIAIENYIEFLKQFASRFNLLFPSSKFPIEAILASETTFLHVHTLSGFQPIKPSNISSELRKFWRHEDNWLRHQLRSHLTQRCPEHLLQSIFGHEDWDIQMFEPDSCSSITELQALTPELDQVAKDFNLKQIDVKRYG